MSGKKKLKLIVILLLASTSKNVLAQNIEDQIKLKTSEIIFQRASDFTNLKKWDSAIYYAKKYRQYTEENFVPLSNGYLNAIYVLGEIYRLKGDLLTAYKYFKKGVDTYSKIDVNATTVDSEIYKFTICRMGIVSSDIGSTAEAKIYLKKGIELFKKTPFGVDGHFQMYACLSGIYTGEGDYKKVDSIWARAQEILDTMAVAPQFYYLQAAVYNNFSVLYSYTGDQQKCLRYLQKSVAFEKLAKEKGYSSEEFIIMELNLAQQYAIMHKIDSAWLLCKDAEDSIPLKSGASYAKLLNTKGLIYQAQNRLEESIDLYTQYKKITGKLNFDIDENDLSLINLSSVYTQTKQYGKADSLLRKQIHHLYTSGRQYAYAMQLAEAALCANLIDIKKYDEAIDSLIVLCGNAFFVMKKNFFGMSEAEKLKYENELNVIFNLLYVAVSRDKNAGNSPLLKIYNLELLRKGMVLGNQLHVLNTAKNTKDTHLLNTYSKWMANRQALAKQYSLPYKERYLNIDSLEEANSFFEKEISAKSYAINMQHAHVKIKTGQALAANISFVRFSYHVNNTFTDVTWYAAIILRSRDSIPKFVNLCSEKDLLAIMKNKNGDWINENQLTQNIYTVNGTKSNLFYGLIWRPLEKYLAGIKTINYSTAGLLNNISFQAICNGKNHLVDLYTFKRYFNLNDADNNEEHTSQKPAALIAWGNINYDKASYDMANVSGNKDNTKNALATVIKEKKDFSVTKNISTEALQSIRSNEINELKRIFINNKIKCETYENSNATEENFKQIVSGFSGILHVSTHGFYSPVDKAKAKDLLPGNFIAGFENPLLRCGLAFAGANYYWLGGTVKNNHDDGILSGYEIAQLDLHNVQLVTLSACETGLGEVTDNEGNIGLQRALKLAGVRNMLVSLWQVPVKQTSELLSSFYANWLKGQTMTAALQRAQKSMSKNYPPYFWAGIVLIQ